MHLGRIHYALGQTGPKKCDNSSGGRKAVAEAITVAGTSRHYWPAGELPAAKQAGGSRSQNRLSRTVRRLDWRNAILGYLSRPSV